MKFKTPYYIFIIIRTNLWCLADFSLLFACCPSSLPLIRQYTIIPMIAAKNTAIPRPTPMPMPRFFLKKRLKWSKKGIIRQCSMNCIAPTSCWELMSILLLHRIDEITCQNNKRILKNKMYLFQCHRTYPQNIFLLDIPDVWCLWFDIRKSPLLLFFFVLKSVTIMHPHCQ